jgi:hypothetical protein
VTRRTFWLALLVAASQISAGCCCWRQHCAGWRIRHWCGNHGGGCCPAYSSPVSTGPGCTSCNGGGMDHGGVVAYGRPVMVPPGGPIPLHAPTPVVTTPAPVGSGPMITPVPNPMPPIRPGS